MKLNSKNNKKFIGVKIDEENNNHNNLNINLEKDIFKIKKFFNYKNNDKNIMKRNQLENINYTIKNYTNKNKIGDYNTIAHDDFSFSNKTENKKIGKINKKIKTINTQGNSIKKLTIKKYHIHNSSNESKKNLFIKKINSSINDKIKSFNHKDKYKSIEDFFYQTFIKSKQQTNFSTQLEQQKNYRRL